MENNVNGQPLVSVIMSCYNHQKYVKEAIESVLAQTYSNFEFLVADDGSTDGSAEVIREFADERMHFFEHAKNTGFRAWEEMERMAKGKYITYIASDDVWREDKLEKQVAFLEANIEYDACFTWVETIDGDSNLASEEGSKNELFNTEHRSASAWYKKLFMETNSLAAPSYMMRNEVFQQLEGFRFKYRQLQDWDLWLRFLLTHKFYIMPEKLTYYRWHENDGTANISAGSSDSIVRTWNERLHIYTEQIELIEDAFFVSAFADNLLQKNPQAHEEVMCEKFFLMLNHPMTEAQQCGINYYLTHISDAEFARCMEEIYGFSRTDFYVMEVNRGVMKGMHEFMLASEESSRLAQTALEVINKLQNRAEI